ncbi:hypothetical protein [Agrobacterium rosae]|uniref:hypothetical protein n=1 Tax=Agrobacterium rosae TaxID=1972867 RepID=UPI003BA24BD3
MVKAYANLHHRGLAAISPVVREKGQRRFRTGWRNLSTVRIGPLCLARKPLKVAVSGHGGPARPPPGVPTAHRPPVERDREVLEAKVRRYTGTRCICPAPEMVRTDRWEKHRPGLAGADLAENGSTLSRASINRRGSGRRQMWPNWQAGCFSNEAPAARKVKGRTLNMSDRFSGKVSPLPSGTRQPWQEDRWRTQTAERGAVRCHI